MNILALLLKPIGDAIFDKAVAYLKDPANRDEIEAAGTWVISKVTDATPWTWDDKLLENLATRIAGGLKIPGLEGLSAAATQFQQFVSRLPNLGGLLGGGR